MDPQRPSQPSGQPGFMPPPNPQQGYMQQPNSGQGYMQQPNPGQGFQPPPIGQQGYAPQPMNQPPQNYSPYMQNNTAPLTMGQYLLMFIILAIPIANFIMPFVWAFGNGNINKKNFAKQS